MNAPSMNGAVCQMSRMSYSSPISDDQDICLKGTSVPIHPFSPEVSSRSETHDMGHMAVGHMACGTVPHNREGVDLEHSSSEEWEHNREEVDLKHMS